MSKRWRPGDAFVRVKGCTPRDAEDACKATVCGLSLWRGCVDSGMQYLLRLLPGLETRKCVSISVLNQSEELGLCDLPWISREIRMADRSATGLAASTAFPRDSSKRKEDGGIP